MNMKELRVTYLPRRQIDQDCTMSGYQLQQSKSQELATGSKQSNSPDALNFQYKENH